MMKIALKKERTALPKRLWGRAVNAVLWLCTLFFIIYGVGCSYLVKKRPEPKVEHDYMFPLVERDSDNEYEFLRLSRLSTDYFFVGAHGNRGASSDADEWIEDRRAGKTHAVLLSTENAAALIRAEMLSRNISLETPIFLMGCNTGSGKESYAKRLSKELHTEVHGIDGWLVIDPYGIARTSKTAVLAFVAFGNFKSRKFINGDEVF